jgi:pimeloyl-ACP methyl ester carboxylesterase
MIEDVPADLAPEDLAAASAPAPVADPTTDDVELRYQVVHGYRRAFRLAGSGPVLLLLHGIGDSSRTWLHVFSTLARRFTVIAPDLLGHGGSDKPRADYAAAAYACGMRDLLAVLDIDRATVVGHSLGGGVAMQFAYQFPERCERLVLVGTGGIARAVHPILRWAAAPGAELVLPLLTAPPAQQLTRMISPLLRLAGGFGLGSDLHYVLERYHALAESSAQRAFLRTLRSVVDRRGQVVTMLDRCYLTEGMPTLLVWGEHDRVIPVRHAHLAHAAMPGSRLEIFADAGHFPHQADPARFVELLTDFIEHTEAAPYEQGHWRELLRTGRPPKLRADPETIDVLRTATLPSGS